MKDGAFLIRQGSVEALIGVRRGRICFLLPLKKLDLSYNLKLSSLFVATGSRSLLDCALGFTSYDEQIQTALIPAFLNLAVGWSGEFQADEKFTVVHCYDAVLPDVVSFPGFGEAVSFFQGVKDEWEGRLKPYAAIPLKELTSDVVYGRMLDEVQAHFDGELPYGELPLELGGWGPAGLYVKSEDLATALFEGGYPELAARFTLYMSELKRLEPLQERLRTVQGFDISSSEQKAFVHALFLEVCEAEGRLYSKRAALLEIMKMSELRLKPLYLDLRDRTRFETVAFDRSDELDFLEQAALLRSIPVDQLKPDDEDEFQPELALPDVFLNEDVELPPLTD